MNNILKDHFPQLYFMFIVNDNLHFEKEPQTGHTEYKRTLVNCDESKIQQYATQMRWRISENDRQIADYYIGVDDDGIIIGLSPEDIIKCVQQIINITKIIQASIMVIILITINNKTILHAKVKIKKKIVDNYQIDFIDSVQI